MMPSDNKIALITDEDFARKHVPPYPKPAFLSFENPQRVKVILEYLDKIKIFENKQIIHVSPKEIDESIIQLAHTKYLINNIKKIASKGGGLIGDEVFITDDSYDLAKKSIGGAISAIEGVVKGEFNQSFAIIRPPGHHAIRENSSGLCLFNNIATAILYLRKRLNYKKKIAIVDIDDHFGDGLCQYFYEDPTVLYMSIHEFDYIDWDVGDIEELGEDEAEGTNINFPVPSGINEAEFLEFLDIVQPVIKEFKPDLIIIATGFDMHFDDPIGSCNLTSMAYFKFAQFILALAEKVCDGKLAFILEGGYSLVGLPFCAQAIITALLHQNYLQPEFEKKDFSNKSRSDFIQKVKRDLKKLLKKYWSLE